jgi:hypothetical protein
MFYYFGLPKQLDPVAFYGDPEFSTSHDYRMARVVSYLKLEEYINKQLIITEKEKHLPPKKREQNVAGIFNLFVKGTLSAFRKTKAGKMASDDEALEFVEESIQAELRQPSDLAKFDQQNSDSNSNNPLQAAIGKLQAQVAAENNDIEYDIDDKGNSEQPPTV